MENYWDRVRNRAYNKYLHRKNHNLQDFPEQDWIEAELEEQIQDKINEEAFLHYKNNGGNPLHNWLTAELEIMQRIQFLAYYMHEREYNKPAYENWLNAEKLYLSKF